MTTQVWESVRGWKSWSATILTSVAVHGLLLGLALWCAREAPRPPQVVPVEAICLTAGSGHAGGGGGQVCAAPPHTAPKPAPPPPRPVKAKPKPKPVKPRPVKKVEEPPVPPALATPRPSAPAPVRPVPTAAVSGGSGSGRGQGVGAGQGAGRGSGPGSGTGSGSGPGTNPGSGSGAGIALKNYLAQVRRLLEQHKTYPWMARRQHREGVVVLKFTIGSHGNIAGQAIAHSSGHELLDGAARETLQKVGRFPPLPPALGRSHLSIQVPLAFRLNES